MKKFVLLASLIIPLCTSAADFSVTPVTIRVPEGFEGPVRQQQHGAVVVGFTKDTGRTSKTLLQISVYDAGSQLEKKDKVKREAVAS